MLEDDVLRRHRGRFLLPSFAPALGDDRPNSPPGRLPVESVERERARGMEQLLAEFGLDIGFPAEALREAESQSERDPFLRGRRRDLADLFVICIDPADARDHDDALSVELLPDGGRRLGIHIADVAQYVREGGALDAEARRRGNSTYFYLDALPMLPPRLSGDLCSLIEGRDRPALSVFLDVDALGRIVESEIVESRLRVTAQLSYEEAETLLEEPGELPDRLRRLHALALLLRGRRAEEGAVLFELPERAPIERDGEVVGFGPSMILRSHAIVEESMLAANREVARFLTARRVATLHRVHEAPDPEDVLKLRAFLGRHALAWLPADPVGSEDYRLLAAAASRRPDRERLLLRMLRSMKRAAYSPSRLGHFGLGWKDYLHFTSPIRRYADLQVHRQVKALLRGGKPPDGCGLESLAAELSERETRSMEAEREGLRLEMVLWARRRLGDLFEARVLAVFSGGLLVRLESCEVDGFLPASILGEEWFEYEEDRERLRGERTGKVYAAGSRLRLRLAHADLFARRIHFSLEEEPSRGEYGHGRESSSKES